MKQALIVCNGSISNYSKVKEKLSLLSDAVYTVTVDGGINHAIQLGMKVDLALGDFDSITPSSLEYLRDESIKTEEYPSDKDKTDSHIAVEHCIQAGCSELIIVAYNGSRLDHSIANIMMFALKSHLVPITLVNENNIAYFVSTECTLHAPVDCYISIIPITETVFVKKTRGLHYTVDNTLLRRGETVGVSNYPVSDPQTIEISEGTALITVSHD